jgi:hypothetical protein
MIDRKTVAYPVEDKKENRNGLLVEKGWTI